MRRGNGLQRLLQFSRVIDRLNEGIGRLTRLLLPLMILLGVWNALGRYLGRFVGENLSSNTLIEGQWYLFSLVFLLGAAYTLKHNGHVRVDALYSHWPLRRQALVNFVGAVLFLIPFCLLMIYFAWGPVLNSWLGGEISNDPGGLARYPIKSMIIVCFVLLGLQGVSEAIKNWVLFTQANPPAPGEDADGI